MEADSATRGVQLYQHRSQRRMASPSLVILWSGFVLQLWALALGSHDVQQPLGFKICTVTELQEQMQLTAGFLPALENLSTSHMCPKNKLCKPNSALKKSNFPKHTNTNFYKIKYSSLLEA